MNNKSNEWASNLFDDLLMILEAAKSPKVEEKERIKALDRAEEIAKELKSKGYEIRKTDCFTENCRS
jgi:hypothetical protein